jgi:hypothetical protein
MKDILTIKGKKMKNLVLMLMIFGFGSNAFANSYTCAKMVYSAGWLKKYEYLGNTWGENTKKSGALSSTFNASVEKTTSSVDPGVTTKNFVSTMQYSSSWGECSILEYNITKQMREDFIDQNMDTIKTEIALGDGVQVDSLAFVSGCRNLNETQWKRVLREKSLDLYDQNDAKGFVKALDQIIIQEKGLNGHCSLVSG